MVRAIFFLSAILLPAGIVVVSSVWIHALWAFVVVGPVIALGMFDVLQTRSSLLRIYPVLGHGRYLFEELRPEIQQYFVESDLNGTPYPREFRSLIYQRAKGARDTVPFGTQRDVDRVGYEWMSQTLAPRPIPAQEPRVRVGGPDCSQPYDASHLNISAMSFGSLSKNAILALNGGARIGGFAHNTGEGGLSPYHLEPGGDLIWQIGTGYFGCRTPEGRFDPKAFAEKSRIEAVKMIEIKLSQGAKPGHGGILPAAKVTREIAMIRGVPPGEDVVSPPAHAEFSTPQGLLEYVAKLRELSGGKPVGFKLCIGQRTEFLGICKAMLTTGIVPDFITVDGAEGGTGAAPVELSNSVGMPMRDGVLFVNNALRGIGVRDRVRVIAAGRLSSAFHLIRAIALGADLCNAARAMMFALGCIQARKCNTNQCPVGVATQQRFRAQGLVVADKAQRVANFHRDTIQAFLELVACAGVADASELSPHHVTRRTDATTCKAYDEIYEYLPMGCLPDGASGYPKWDALWDRAVEDRFLGFDRP
jgi:glutamate synthase domain-containing protein 2